MKRVLIVDDIAENLYFLETLLKGNGFEVAAADNGVRALVLARSNPPDLIISDILMPVMDGYALCKEWRSDELLRRIPFIFYTATYTDKKDEELALKLGANRFIIKPLEPDALMAIIRGVLDTSSLADTSPATLLQEDESVLLKGYSEVLFRKLENKMADLEEMNRVLQESREDFRQFIMKCPLPIAISYRNGTTELLNERFTQVMGYTLDDIPCVDVWWNLAYPDPAYRTKVAANWEAATKKALSEGGDIHPDDAYQVTCKDGTVHTMEIYAALVTNCEMVIFNDLTERKEAAEKLSQSETEFRQLSQEFHGLLDGIPDSLLLLDKNLNILWANKTAAEAIGETPESLTGRSCHELWYNRMTPCEPCPARESFASGKPTNETVTRPDGRICDVRIIPLADEQENVTRVIQVNRDITEHKKLETQYLHAQKMESIGTMAGGVAHDFNNILTAILGFGQLALKNTSDDTPQRRHIQGILEAADRAANLTRELLLFSRKQKGELLTIDLNKIVDKTENFLLRIIGEDISLKLLPYAGPLPIFGDSNQLEQVLMNLAVNARDAMPQGGEFILKTEQAVLDNEFVAAHGFGKPGDYALVSVSDNGSGMDRETVLRIFEPFFTTKDVGKGTGLGLSVVYGIVKQHDGFVTVQSEPGRGTIFSIYLPLTESAPQRIPTAEKQSFAGGTETVLLAEDNDLVRQLVTTLLSGAGYTVIEAVDGEEAVTKFKEHADSIHLLLFDLIMPKMNGKEAADAIHRINPAVKTIFTSGYSPEIAQMKAALDNGFHLIQKPVSPHDLLKKIRSVLDGSA